MNASYFELIPKVFKNAELVIDRFHVVQCSNRAFNQFRVREIKKLLGEKIVSEANKMRANWRKYLKYEDNINHSEYKLPDTLDSELRATFENLLSYQEGIQNSLIYSYSNGHLKAKNTHIKTLKRISYGFESFYNMKTRIFLTEGLIKIK